MEKQRDIGEREREQKESSDVMALAKRTQGKRERKR